MGLVFGGGLHLVVGLSSLAGVLEHPRAAAFVSAFCLTVAAVCFWCISRVRRHAARLDRSPYRAGLALLAWSTVPLFAALIAICEALQ